MIILNQEINIPSLAGVSLENVKGPGHVSILQYLNCETPHYSDPIVEKQALFILDQYAYPTLVLKAKNNTDTYERLFAVQLTMFSNEKNNKILLNNECQFMVHVEFKNDFEYSVNAPVTPSNVEKVKGIYPTKNNDPNAAHVMLIKLDKWYCSFDFVYNKKRSRKRFKHGEDFLSSAITNKRKRRWGPFIDSLFNFVELTVQSLLFSTYNKFSQKQSHESTLKLFKSSVELGNYEQKYYNLYKKLTKLRNPGRYMTGLHGKDFEIDKTTSQKLLDATLDLKNYTENFFKTEDLSREPKKGHYISITKVQSDESPTEPNIL